MTQPLPRQRLAAGGVAILAWPLLHAVLPQGLPAGVVLQGVVLGSLTGLTAVGLVLVYQASRIVNFAQATLGSAAAVLTTLFQAGHWNYYVAFTTGLAAAAAVGVLADRLVVQRFFWASLLVLTVATIGLAQILSGVELASPQLFEYGGPLGGLSGGFTTPLDVHFDVSPLVFSGAHVTVLLVVPVVLAALTPVPALQLGGRRRPGQRRTSHAARDPGAAPLHRGLGTGVRTRIFSLIAHVHHIFAGPAGTNPLNPHTSSSENQLPTQRRR